MKKIWIFILRLLSYMKHIRSKGTRRIIICYWDPKDTARTARVSTFDCRIEAGKEFQRISDKHPSYTVKFHTVYIKNAPKQTQQRILPQT